MVGEPLTFDTRKDARMSKLSDRIRSAGRTEPAPLGFGAAARVRRPSMLVVVRLSAGEAGKASDATKAGADAVIIEGEPGNAKDAGAIVGVLANSTDAASADALRDAGADFLVLDPAKDLAEAMLNEKLGFVLQVREEMDDTRLRLLSDLNLDAILVPAPETPLTVAKLLEFRRVASFARAPVLVEADPAIGDSLLHVLRESGTAGVVVPASGIGSVADLKQRIDALPARGKRKDERGASESPMVPAGAHLEHDHDDYDDDDDD